MLTTMKSNTLFSFRLAFIMIVLLLLVGIWEGKWYNLTFTDSIKEYFMMIPTIRGQRQTQRQQSLQQQQFDDCFQQQQQQEQLILYRQQQQPWQRHLVADNTSTSSSTSDSAVLFGTSNGYDSGGTGSMCWNTMVSALDNNNYNGGMASSRKNNSIYGLHNQTATNDASSNALDDNQNSNTNITFDNITLGTVTDKIFNLAASGQSDAIESSLLSSCYVGTSMEVIPVDMPVAPREMLTSTDYTFQINVEMDLSYVTDSNYDPDVMKLPKSPRNSSITVCYVRLMLCDAVRTGFCNPLRDTRSVEDNLSSNQTDWQPPSSSKPTNHINNMTNDSPMASSATHANSESQNGSDAKLLYQQGSDILLGVNDGPYIFTRWVIWSFMPEHVNSTIYKSSVNITMRLPFGTRKGAYFFVGHACITLFDVINDTIQRIDVAAALPDNVVAVSDPPTILYVTKQMKIFLGVVTGIFGSIALAMFVYTVYHRNHVVIRLAQGSFLAALIGACFLQILFIFTILPTKDIFCVIGNVCCLIPQTVTAAILVARMWRAYSIIHAAQKIGGHRNRRQKKSPWFHTAYFEEKFVNALTYIADPVSPLLPSSSMFRRRGSSSMINQGGIRSQIPAYYSITLIILLSVPQVFVQVFAAIYYPAGLKMIYNSDETVGQYQCDLGNTWSGTFGFFYITFVFLLAVCMAWISRALPSAFNEKDEVFHVAVINAMLAVIGLVLASMVDAPTTQPDFMIFVTIAITIASATIVLKSLAWPKLIRVYRGEKVVLGAVFQSKFAFDSSLSKPSHQSDHETNNSTLTPNGHPTLRQEDDETYHDTNKLTTGDASPTPATANGVAVGVVTSQTHSDDQQRKFTIREGDPLPSKVERQIHHLQLLLRDVSSQLCDGRAISAEEFELLKLQVMKLQSNLDCVDMEKQSLIHI